MKLSRTVERSTSPSDAAVGPAVVDRDRLLDANRCPTCVHVEETERRFFAWFSIENHADAAMRTRLRDSMGMCPAHVRRLLGDAGDGYPAGSVMRQATSGACDRLRGQGVVGRCPACEAAAFATGRVRRLLIDGVNDPGFGRRYGEHHGLCLRHAVDAVAIANRSAAPVLSERMLATLADQDGDGSIEALAGADPDLPARAGWSAALPAEPVSDSTVDGLLARLGLETCPVCLSAGWAELGYLRWFAERSKAADRSLEDDPGEFCGTHLHDLNWLDERVAARVASRQRAARRGELRRVLDRLAVVPSERRWRQRQVAAEFDIARGEFVAAHFCPACHARDGVERSQLELVLAAITVAPVRERYLRAHGLCARHALLADKRDGGAAVRAHAQARLEILAWELRESERKRAWSYRHELAGPEQHAWLRVIAQVDGRVFRGGAPPLG